MLGEKSFLWYHHYVRLVNCKLWIWFLRNNGLPIAYFPIIFLRGACMNMRDLVVPVGFALITVFALNYFFPGNSTKKEDESSFVAPRERKEYKPLNVEVDFFDQKRVVVQKKTEIDTSWGTLNFSTDGASLDSVDFKRESDGQMETIRTVFPVTDTEREERCFLVGLQEQTPFYYNLLSVEETDNAYEVKYGVDGTACAVQKTFIVNKNSPQIDLLLDIYPKVAVEPRILFPSPLMPDLKENDSHLFNCY